jgi:hypothetical protein
MVKLTYLDGALMRDTRMVERKKTGRAKARKAVSLVISETVVRADGHDRTPGLRDRLPCTPSSYITSSDDSAHMHAESVYVVVHRE